MTVSSKCTAYRSTSFNVLKNLNFLSQIMFSICFFLRVSDKSIGTALLFEERIVLNLPFQRGLIDLLMNDLSGRVFDNILSETNAKKILVNCRM